MFVSVLSPCATLANRRIKAVSWQDAQKRVLKSYREWLRSVSCFYDNFYLFDTDGLCVVGSRDPADVLAQLPCLCYTDQNTAGVRKA